MRYRSGGSAIKGPAFVGALALLFALAACDDPSAPPASNATGAAGAASSTAGGAVIASYDGVKFTEGDLRAELERLNRRSRRTLDDPERLAQFVENHVLASLIFHEGEKRGLADDSDIERQVEDLRRRLVIQKVMQEHQSAPVSDEDVRAYYDAHPEEFTSDRVRASHILVKEEAEAKDIMEKLEDDPDSFGKLAEEHSIDRSNSSKGGDLGFFGRGRMVKEFEDAAFGLTEDGQISDIVRTRFGFHIIKRTGREDGTAKPFDEVKNQIRIRLINDKRRSQTEEFLAKLKKDADLSVDKQALEQFDLGMDDETSEEDGGDDAVPASVPSGH